jgi:hypothetical protein
METDDRAFVAIIGGFFDLDGPTKTRAKQYGNELGKALAEAGFGLIVYFSDENSLEPYVVEGYVAASPPNAPARSIRVRYPESQKEVVKFKEQDTRRPLFDPKLLPLNDWEAPFYRSLVEPGGADAVLLMAGKRSVLIAGQIAVARRLPTLAVDEFAGTATIIWRELSQSITGYPSAATATPAQLVGWLKEACNIQAQERQRAEKRQRDYLSATASAPSSWATAIASLALLAVLALGVRRSPSADSYAVLMFVGLMVSGATGALARTIIWGRSGALKSSITLGALAGLVVGLAYLIPQLIGAPGVFSSANTAVAATDKIQFVSAILTAFSAGVGFDTIFDRLRGQAADLSIKAQANK